MRNYLFNYSIIAFIPLIIGLNSPSVIEPLTIGSHAPMESHKMKSVAGTELTLLDLKQENGIVVIFSCNTCPFVVGNGDMSGWEDRYNELYKNCQSLEIGMVLVNSNEAKRLKGDSFNDMQTHSKKENYLSPYVIDKNNLLADAFGASTTPHVFLFNKELNLVYKGAIDDNVKSKKEVKKNWLKDALSSLAKGENITPSETRNSGCSIKRL